MASERIAAGVRAGVIAGAGALAATSAAAGLYANTVLALLIGAWTAGAAVFAARPVVVPPPPVPRARDEADERRRLLAYLDLSPAPLVVREATALVAVNRAARRLFATDDAVRDPPPDLLAALADTPTGRTATVTLTENGVPRPYALAIGELALAGRVARVGALLDIGAELKAAEAATLRDLVQILSHEVVNTLTPIASLAETAAAMLGDPDPPLDDVRAAIETVARRAAGLHRFGESYRSLARLPPPDRRPIVTGALVADLQRLFAVRWPAIGLVVQADAARTTRLLADPDQLSAALWAVLQNAAEAVSGAADPVVRLSVETAAGGLHLDIANAGPPIATGDADRIFQPFVTTRPDGNGVGLALARQIARAHGGEVMLERSDAHETRFRFALPLAGHR